jgi:hypothetical protein
MTKIKNIIGNSSVSVSAIYITEERMNLSL